MVLDILMLSKLRNGYIGILLQEEHHYAAARNLNDLNAFHIHMHMSIKAT